MEDRKYPQVYAVINKDENVRRESRSGGAFTAVSNQILKEQGVVYGAVLVDNTWVQHIRADDTSGRDAMRGSKYIQSSTKNTFREVREDLAAGKKVLYTGTPCQIAGLKSYLKKTSTDNLYCVDIVCYGVPSPLIWQKYVRFLEKKYHSICTDVDFRDKKTFGWRAHFEAITLRSKLLKLEKKYFSDTFKNLFIGRNILRPSCYHCPYKSFTHPGDLTLADYWGIEKAAPEMSDDKGVSLVLVNNERGQELFESIKPYVKFKATRIEDSIQPSLQAPVTEPSDRAAFWNDYHTIPFRKLLKKYVQKKGMRGFLHNLRIMKRVISSKWSK